MKNISIQGDIINAQHISMVHAISRNEPKRLRLSIYGSTHYWDFPDSMTCRTERARVLREWRAANKPVMLKARLASIKPLKAIRS